jgi:hypothetical protein
MKRTAALSFSNSKPLSDGVGGLLPTVGARNVEPKPNRPPAGYRSDLRDSKLWLQSRPRSARKPGTPKHSDSAWEVLDDLPEVVPVREREIQVIETYLAELLNELSASTRRRK